MNCFQKFTDEHFKTQTFSDSTKCLFDFISLCGVVYGLEEEDMMCCTDCEALRDEL